MIIPNLPKVKRRLEFVAFNLIQTMLNETNVVGLMFETTNGLCPITMVPSR